jgi:error-prone DNA polymerase
MLAVLGRIQREGEVVHLVAHHLTDWSAELANVGHRDEAFPVQHGRGDQVRHEGLRPRDIYIPDLHIDTIKVKTRDFR